MDVVNAKTFDADRVSGQSTSVIRALFVITVMLAGSLFWMAPRLPLSDLPQHAAQVALLHDLLVHASPWSELVRINYFTPYLIGYGLALPLTFVVSVSSALKAVLTLAFFGFVGASVALRRALGGDPRLDWLFIPGYFGYAFIWGFYTFLVAAPITIVFILIAQAYAKAPSPGRGASLFLGGAVLFFSHGLMFLFGAGVGGLMLLARQRTLPRLIATCAPFVALGVLCVAYSIVMRATDPIIALGGRLDWGWDDMRRIGSLPLYVWSTSKHDSALLLATLAMFAAPWLLRDRPNWRDPMVLAPFAVILLIWFVAPNEAMQTQLLYQRFAVLLLPAYAFAFCAGSAGATPGGLTQRAAASPRGGAVGARGSRRDTAVQLLLALACWIGLGAHAVRLHRFEAESASFERLLEHAEPGQRALSVILDDTSPAYAGNSAYRHYPVWYQAEKSGLVDMNFAWYVPEIIRYRSDHLPAVRPGTFFTADHFDWDGTNAQIYRYFFVRSSTPVTADYFANPHCTVALIAQADQWSLFERQSCK